MRVSGSSMKLFFIVFSLFIWIVCSSNVSFSGNKWMMEKNKDELLLLNSKLLERLGELKKDGEIVLKGNVVFRNGKTIIRIHHLQNFTSTPDKNVDLFEASGMSVPYKIFLREESLPEIPVVEKEKGDVSSDAEKNY